MAYEPSTFEELHQLGVDLAAKLLPDDDSSEGSYNWRITGVQAGIAVDNQYQASKEFEELLPDKAVGGALDRWGTILNLPRKGATPARKANALRLSGTAGSPFTIGEELVSAGGLRYQLNESGVMPAEETLDVDVIAIDTGAATRLAAREQLTFVVELAGIAPEAELQLALDEDGEDAEQDGPYSQRLIDRLRQPPLGGATEDYRTWARQVSGVASAYVYPLRGGLGTVDVVGLHRASGTARIFNPTERTTLLTYLTGKRPVSVAGLRVLETLPQLVDVEVMVRPLAARLDFDWVDQVPPVVSAWNAGTRTLTLTAPRPDTMTASGRVVIATIGGTAAAIAIESLPVTNTQLVLEEVPPVAPAPGDLVYAGGPLTEPCRAAIAALIDSLGSANPDANRYGEWEGNLRLLDLGNAVRNVEGAYTPVVVSPVADVEAGDPAYPLDGAIYLLVGRRILVRKRW